MMLKTTPGRVTAWALAHRALVLAVAVSILLASGMGAALGLRIDLSSARFFGNADPELATLREFQATFGPDDNVLVLVVEAPDAATPELLAYQTALADAVATSDEVVSVVDLPSQIIPGTGVRVDRFLATGPPASGLLALENSPAVPGLLAKDRSAAAVIVYLRNSTDDVRATIPVYAELSAIVETVPAPDDAQVSMGGVPAIRGVFFDLVLRDQMRLVPLTVLIVGLGLLLAFRRFDAVVAGAVGAGLPVAATVGVLVLAGQSIGLLNQTYFTLLPVIAVADVVHYMARFEREQRLVEEEPAGRRKALVATSRHVGFACLLTTLTTALAFFSLLFARAPVLRQFGVFAAIGVCLAYLALLTVVPVVLSFLSTRPRPESPRPALRGLARFSVGRPWLVTCGFGLLSLGALYVAPKVEVDNVLRDLVHADHPVHRASEIIDTRLGGTLSLEVVAAADQAPALHELALNLDQDARVRVLAPIEIVDGRSRLSVRTADMGGQAFEAFATHVRTQAESIGLQATLTGTALVAYRGVNDITRQLRKSLLVMLLVVAATILVVLPNRALTLAAAVVNIVPLLWGYAALALLGVTLDPLAAVILTLGLGIAVDDTLHLAARYSELETGSEIEAQTHTARMEATLQGTGRAVTATSLMLAAGLAINLLASFPTLVVLGSLGALVILFALVADLLLLPALITIALRIFVGTRKSRRGSKAAN